MPTNLLSVRSLDVGYRSAVRKALLAGVEFDVHAGELVAVLGPNGAGKSTLLRTMAGLLPALAGTISILGKSSHEITTSDRAKLLACGWTRSESPTAMPAEELIALGRLPYRPAFGGLSADDLAAVAEAADWMGLSGVLGRPVGELSDGQRQRVQLARIIAQNARITILDEPTAFLDVSARAELFAKLRLLARGRSCCILLSTHDLEIALTVCDQILLVYPSKDDPAVAGNWHYGIPESLALEGILSKAFSSDYAVFDPAEARFRVANQTCQPIGFVGAGESAEWTKRALTRLGFRPVPPSEEPTLQVVVQSAEFRLVQQQQDKRFSKLDDLIAYLLMYGPRESP